MIVIVEDDPAVRRSLQMLLLANGHEVRTHASGAALLADKRPDAPDCLITDYRLSGMDGIALLQTLRAQGWECPAILITAFASAPLRDSAIAAGFQLVFEKPLRQHALADAVARLSASDAKGYTQSARTRF